MNKHTVTAISEVFIQLALALFVFVALSGVSEAGINGASVQSIAALSSDNNRLKTTAKVRALKSETVPLDEDMFLSASARAAKHLVETYEQLQGLNAKTISATDPGLDYKVQRRSAHLYNNQSGQGYAVHDQAWPFLSVKIQSKDLALKIGSQY
jgi:hypothetical protein